MRVFGIIGLAFVAAVGIGAWRMSEQRSLAHGSTALASDEGAPTAPIAEQSDTAPPDLPRLLNTSVENTPSTGRTLNVGPRDNLQAAIDAARPGDKIVVACARYRGSFVLSPKSGGVPGGWITLTSASPLPEGTRATPTLTAPACYATLSSTGADAALSARPGAARWRIVGIEATADPTVMTSNNLVMLGSGSESNPARVPRNIILDRSYVHGSPAMWLHRCVEVNADSVAVIDSYVSECHADIDAQAVWGWNSNGPVKITNNHLEASTEVVGFGGADPAVHGAIPSDIEIRHNHITRPMAWKGGKWLVKNLVEFKAGRRVLIQGNVLDNNWPHGQAGYAVVLWSVNQGGKCPWCGLSEVTFENNVIRNVTSGFQLTASFSTPSVPLHHVLIRNNVLIGVDNPAVADAGIGFLIGSDIRGLSIEHNTMFLPRTSTAALQYAVEPTRRLIAHSVRNNLLGGGKYPIFLSPAPHWAEATDANAHFAGNVIGFEDAASFASSFQLPPGNSFPASADEIGLAGGSAAALRVDASLDQLALAPSSPFKHKATDGKDPGADIAAVKRAVAGVAP